ncbi:MAG TPA: FtsQ-type POTRA domain-containing protein [Actinotalea caeni]|uniref:cell division protein FtsQ/DivIB n=1 Tax=Actinotalea caeni TaxID=1348467 RepID=UPI002B4AB5E0|nr:FtsQ-type POTRA domain-containing protein [Actinotalea caeni]HLV56638.1 FtsQ-type POTRA domain-containing protein [Actinotalea caeni]
MARRPTLPPSIPPASRQRTARSGGTGTTVAVAERASARTDRVSDGLTERLEERRRARRRLRLRAVAMVVAGVLVLAGVGWVALASSLLALRLDDVEVVGTDDIARSEDVLAVVAPHEGEPLLRLDAPRLRDELEAVAGVGEATVRRVLPHGLEITVVPRVPVATVAAEDGYVLLDAEGVELAVTQEPHEGVPVVDVPVGSDTTAEALEAVLTAMAALGESLLQRVVSVSAPTAYEVELVLDSGARVVWGSAEDSELKAAVLERLLQVPAEVYDVSAPLNPITR